jgi:hypothetical protein
MKHNIDRAIEGARRYAAADRSDPFALRRALTHVANGIATGFTQNGEEATYNAEAYQEKRWLPKGEEYTVTAYRNMRRP